MMFICLKQCLNTLHITFAVCLMKKVKCNVLLRHQIVIKNWEQVTTSI